MDGPNALTKVHLYALCLYNCISLFIDPVPQCVAIDITVKKGSKIDPTLETKFGAELNDKIDLKDLLPTKQGIVSVTCDEGISNITITFNSITAVKEFHDNFRYEDIRTFVNQLFEQPKVQKIFGNAGYSIYVDVNFSMPEAECKGLPEPDKNILNI